MSMCMSWLYPFKKIKGFPLKVKSLQNTATYKKKLRGRVPSTPPPPPPNPLCTAVGVWICEDVKGLNFADTSGTVTGDTRKKLAKSWPVRTSYDPRGLFESYLVPVSFWFLNCRRERTNKLRIIILFWETVHLPLPLVYILFYYVSVKQLLMLSQGRDRWKVSLKRIMIPNS